MPTQLGTPLTTGRSMTAFDDMVSADMTVVTDEEETALPCTYHSQAMDLPQRCSVLLFYEKRNFEKIASGRVARTEAVATLVKQPAFTCQRLDRLDVDGQNWAVWTDPVLEFGVYTLELAVLRQESFNNMELYDDV